MAEAEEQVAQESSESARAKLKSMIMIAGGAIMVATLSVAGTWFLLSRDSSPNEEMTEGMTGENGEGAEAAPQGPALYLSMQPAFIVNYTTGARTRFLQLELSLVARDPAVIDAANTHMPLIRNNFLEVLARQNYQELQTVAGKEKLVEELTESSQTIMQQKIGKPGIETVLFRSFVMQ